MGDLGEETGLLGASFMDSRVPASARKKFFSNLRNLQAYSFKPGTEAKTCRIYVAEAKAKAKAGVGTDTLFLFLDVRVNQSHGYRFFVFCAGQQLSLTGMG